VANIVVLSGRMTRYFRSGTDATGDWAHGALSVPGYRDGGAQLFHFSANGMPATIAIDKWKPGKVATLQGFLRPAIYTTANGRRHTLTFHVASFEALHDKETTDFRPPDVEYSPPPTVRRPKTRDELAAQMPTAFEKKIPEPAPRKPVNLE